MTTTRKQTTSPAATVARKAAPAKAVKAAVKPAAKPEMKPEAKRAAPATANPLAPESAKAAKQRQKLIRDSFTIPKSEYLLLNALKLRAATLARPTKKSEVLRAGISALSSMNDKSFLAALDTVPSLKTGRPKGENAAEE